MSNQFLILLASLNKILVLDYMSFILHLRFMGNFNAFKTYFISFIGKRVRVIKKQKARMMLGVIVIQLVIIKVSFHPIFSVC